MHIVETILIMLLISIKNIDDMIRKNPLELVKGVLAERKPNPVKSIHLLNYLNRN